MPVGKSGNILIGVVLVVIGLGVTFVSYSSASAGGSYVVAWGAVLVGIIRIIRGLAAPEQPVVPKHVAPRVPRAEVTKERPSSNDAPSEPEDDPLLAGADLLAAAEGAEPLAPRPRAARKLRIESHSAESATAVEAAQQVASPGSAAGTGFGANGGPGGTGAGCVGLRPLARHRALNRVRDRLGNQ